MKIFPIISFGVIFISFLSSCQKGINGDTTTTTTSASAKVKTYTEDLNVSGAHSITTFNLSYDASDRLTSMVSASSAGDKFVFQYNSNTSYTMDLYNSNKLSIHEIFILNSISFVDSTFQYNDTQDTMTEKYYYNTAKQLVKLNEYDYKKSTGAVLWNTHNYVYDANGNIISDTDGSFVITYDYYTNLINNSTLIPIAVPNSKNYIKTERQTSGGVTEVLNYTYTFDSNNRLSTEKITITGSTDNITKTYTYY